MVVAQKFFETVTKATCATGTTAIYLAYCYLVNCCTRSNLKLLKACKLVQYFQIKNVLLSYLGSAYSYFSCFCLMWLFDGPDIILAGAELTD